VGIAAELESEEEQKLAKKISELWAVHVQTKDVVKKTKEEIKGIRGYSQRCASDHVTPRMTDSGPDH
jgi:hypothetical protein